MVVLDQSAEPGRGLCTADDAAGVDNPDVAVNPGTEGKPAGTIAATTAASSAARSSLRAKGRRGGRVMPSSDIRGSLSVSPIGKTPGENCMPIWPAHGPDRPENRSRVLPERQPGTGPRRAFGFNGRNESSRFTAVLAGESARKGSG